MIIDTDVLIWYFKGNKNALELADAIIGTTALENHETLLTGNYKHYKIIQDLRVEIFKPAYNENTQG